MGAEVAAAKELAQRLQTQLEEVQEHRTRALQLQTSDQVTPYFRMHICYYRDLTVGLLHNKGT